MESDKQSLPKSLTHKQFYWKNSKLRDRNRAGICFVLLVTAMVHEVIYQRIFWWMLGLLLGAQPECLELPSLNQLAQRRQKRCSTRWLNAISPVRWELLSETHRIVCSQTPSEPQRTIASLILRDREMIGVEKNHSPNSSRASARSASRIFCASSSMCRETSQSVNMPTA